MKDGRIVEIRGEVEAVSGPTIVARGMRGVKMNATARVGERGLLGEVIRLDGDRATLQVYEETFGLKPGDAVRSGSKPLSVLLGPGLLGSVFDGIQRPLDVMASNGEFFIKSGHSVSPLDMEREWEFKALVRPGDKISGGDVVGTVAETGRIEHRVMTPQGFGGVVARVGHAVVKGNDAVVELEDGRSFGLYHEWPVRMPRAAAGRIAPSKPFITGQRVFDTLLPVAEGGTAIVPGGFGTGKTVVEQTIARFALSDVIVYIGCGERGNEIAEVLREFPRLVDPITGRPLSERTITIVNTSNMPVAAREASIFTGVAIAEYYRDMGYSVALMTDSLSRWAEALREISSRLEELPGEEGFPPYLSSLIGSFYERAGRVKCLGAPEREGSLTIIGAISPPGGDFSEPVTQASIRFAGALWALDAELAYRRHYPAVSWEASFSRYYRPLAPWYAANVAPDMDSLRARLLSLLQREAEIKEIAQVIGMDSLQEADRLVLETAELARETFLKQSVFVEADSFATLEKQYWMLRAIFAFMDAADRALKAGRYLEAVLESEARKRLGGMHLFASAGFEAKAIALIADAERELLTGG
jgi:V/A-type H+-transporting ATPase subunit A